MNKSILTLSVSALVFLAACSDPQSPAGEKFHPSGWVEVTSSSFHGEVLAAKQYETIECQSCHGSEYDGGRVEVSCKSQACHPSFPHPEGWACCIGPISHGEFLKREGYNLNSCQACHGQQYDVVKVKSSCLTCHTNPGGPEACNTCHGDFAGDATNLATAAPPKGLDDETSPATPAVGAHQAHLSRFSYLGVAGICQECHTVPEQFSAAGHLGDDLSAEVQFNGTLATTVTEDGNRVPNVSYDPATNTCSESYCHGNWGLLKAKSQFSFNYAAEKMEGNAASPTWTDPTTAECGSCHALPPAGHNPADLSACAGCHGATVDFSGTIIDSTRHVNGKANVFGQEYPMF